jgi:hypothetical protein
MSATSQEIGAPLTRLEKQFRAERYGHAHGLSQRHDGMVCTEGGLALCYGWESYYDNTSERIERWVAANPAEGAAVKPASVEVRRALGRLSRAAVSLKSACDDARTAGTEWEWLANDLRNVAEKLESVLHYARTKLPQQRRWPR